MPRRVAGVIWGIRLTMTLSPEEERQLKIPNTVCVFHAGGSRGNGKFQEKPHYHLYYNAGSEVVKETVQQMIKTNDIVKKYYKASNGFWSVEPNEKYDLESYWTYVWDKNPLKRQRLIWWDIETPQLPIPESPLIHDAPPLNNTQVVYLKTKQKTSAEKQQAFYEYCREYYDRKQVPVDPAKVCYLLVKYCETKGFTPESSLSTWVRYAYLNLLGKPEKKLARSALAEQLYQKFF